MTESFKKTILNYPHPLFYNTRGNLLAYKLHIRHLSFAPILGLAQMAGKRVYPRDRIHIVDFEQENIDIISEPIELIELRILK